MGELNGCANTDLTTPEEGCRLTVKNLYFDANENACIYAGSRTKRQSIWLENITADNCSRLLMGAYEYPIGGGRNEATFNDIYHLIDDTCFGSSSHCVYIDRVAEAYVTGGEYYWTPNGMHPLKVDSKYQEIDGVYAGNVSPTGQRNPEGGPGHIPFSTISCATGFVRNSTFQYDGDIGQSYGSGINFQPRHDIAGCDIPPYNSTEFWDPAYWVSPDSFPKTVSNNTFILLNNPVGIENAPVVSMSTAPLENAYAGSTTMQYIPRPDEWVERATAVVESNNTYIGYGAEDIICAGVAWGSVLPGDVPPPPQSELDKLCTVQ